MYFLSGWLCLFRTWSNNGKWRDISVEREIFFFASPEILLCREWTIRIHFVTMVWLPIYTKCMTPSVIHIIFPFLLQRFIFIVIPKALCYFVFCCLSEFSLPIFHFDKKSPISPFVLIFGDNAIYVRWNEYRL